jgi:hypothetical protein
MAVAPSGSRQPYRSLPTAPQRNGTHTHASHHCTRTPAASATGHSLQLEQACQTGKGSRDAERNVSHAHDVQLFKAREDMPGREGRKNVELLAVGNHEVDGGVSLEGAPKLFSVLGRRQGVQAGTQCRLMNTTRRYHTWGGGWCWWWLWLW